MNFFFECPVCGTYTVDKDTFEAVLTPELRERLHSRLKSEVEARPIVRFEGDCLKCRPDSEHRISLEIETRTGKC
jgi:hypothetical protein